MTRVARGFLVLGLAACAACASMPEPTMVPHSFPKEDAFVGIPQDRPFKPLGRVRAKVDYDSLDPNHDEAQLCRNYYNKAVSDLLKQARKQGGDAVVGVRSVVFLVNGQVEAYAKPECSDDGEGGQIAVEGAAVKWIVAKPGEPAPRGEPIPEKWLTPLQGASKGSSVQAPNPQF